MDATDFRLIKILEYSAYPYLFLLFRILLNNLSIFRIKFWLIPDLVPVNLKFVRCLCCSQYLHSTLAS